MRIEVGSKVSEYLSGLSTIALGVYSSHVAAQIARGPVCLLLFLLSAICLGIGISIIFKVFSFNEHSSSVASSIRKITPTPANQKPSSTNQ